MNEELLEAGELGKKKKIRRIMDQPDIDLNATDNDGMTVLMRSSAIGQGRAIKYFLQNKKIDRHSRSQSDWHAVHYASYQGNAYAVKKLLKKRADPNTITKEGLSCLMLACKAYKPPASAASSGVNDRDGQDYDTCITTLLTKGARPTITDEDGWTALHYACAFPGDLDLVKMILKFEFDVNACTRHGETSLMLAGVKGFDKIAEFLIVKGADTNLKTNDDRTALHHCIWQGHRRCTEVILKADADVEVRDIFGETPMHAVAKLGDHQSFQMLLQAFADVNAVDEEGNSPLHFACAKDHRSIIDGLLKSGASPNLRNDHGVTPLHEACIEGFESCVQVLLDNGATINFQDNDGATAVIRASQYGNDTCLALLLKAKPDLSLSMRGGFTALHMSCQYGHVKCIELLVKAGIDINAVSNKRQTALSICCFYSNVQCFDLILEQSSVQLEKADTNGLTPLMTAAIAGSVHCTKGLISKMKTPRDAVELKDKRGNTALHYACLYKQEEVCEALVKAGASWKQQNKFKQTPLTIACSNGYFPCVEQCLQARLDHIKQIKKVDGEQALKECYAKFDQEHVYCVKLLLKAIFKARHRHKHPTRRSIRQSVKKGYAKCVEVLLSERKHYYCTMTKELEGLECSKETLNVLTQLKHWGESDLVIRNNEEVLEMQTKLNSTLGFDIRMDPPRSTDTTLDLSSTTDSSLDIDLNSTGSTDTESTLGPTGTPRNLSLTSTQSLTGSGRLCTYQMQAWKLFKKLNISDEHMDPANDDCFCEECDNISHRQYYYRAGNPPCTYAVPVGWVKFGIKVKKPEEAAKIDIDSHWHHAYHGTHHQCISSIIETGSLKKGSKRQPPPWLKESKDGVPSIGFAPPGSYEGDKVNLSPSVRYAGHLLYAPAYRFKDPETRHMRKARVICEVLIRPGSYLTKPSTLPEKQIDPGFPDSQINWCTRHTEVVTPIGLLVKIENDDVDRPEEGLCYDMPSEILEKVAMASAAECLQVPKYFSPVKLLERKINYRQTLAAYSPVSSTVTLSSTERIEQADPAEPVNRSTICTIL